MTCLYWHGLHIKTYINDKTFYNVLLPLAVSLHIYTENSDVVNTLKKGAKDTKDSNLTILPCYVNIFCPCEVPGSK